MSSHISKLTVAALLTVATAQAKIPDWAKRDTTQVNGKIVTTICSGTGPSIDIARKDAIKSCQTTVSQFLTTTIKVKSLSVQTEKFSGLHEEVTQNYNVDGLTCIPEKDEVVEGNNSFNVWIKCKFDLNQASTETVKSDEPSNKNENLNKLEVGEISQNTNYFSKQILISVVPKCESLIIRGQKPRVIECKTNPTKIQILENDTEAIVRSNGYKPKTINLKGSRNNENIQVLLDLL